MFLSYRLQVISSTQDRSFHEGSRLNFPVSLIDFESFFAQKNSPDSHLHDPGQLSYALFPFTLIGQENRKGRSFTHFTFHFDRSLMGNDNVFSNG